MTHESPPELRFTFLHGVRVRSGTNYLGKIMSCNPQVQLVPPGKTTDEFPFLKGLDSWEAAHASFVNKYNGDRSAFAFGRFLPHLGAAWRAYVAETFGLRPGHVFVKEPSVRHLDRFFELFPDAKLILLVRDGRDNVASSVKANLATRARTSIAREARARLNHLLLRDFVLAARDWAGAVAQVHDFDAKFRGTPFSSRYLILRYEDVFQDPRPFARRIFEFMEVPFDDAVLDAVENAEVVGSSFYSARGKEDAHKPNWISTPKTAAFRPVGRWKSWSDRHKRVFKRIAGQELIRAGYEKDSSW